ncbi:MAG: hypothetical protein ACKV22_27860 [Bryobacteraceae bacterium]
MEKLPIRPAMLLAGMAVAGLGIGAILWIQRGAHIELKGSVLKARTIGLEPQSSIAVLDFRFTNPSDYPFVVRGVEVLVDDGKQQVAGESVAEVDARRLFEYYPALGQKYNDSLIARVKIPPRTTMDRMICVRFPVPEGQLTARKRFIIKVEDVDGPVAEILEQAK